MRPEERSCVLMLIKFPEKTKGDRITCLKWLLISRLALSISNLPKEIISYLSWNITLVRMHSLSNIQTWWKFLWTFSLTRSDKQNDLLKSQKLSTVLEQSEASRGRLLLSGSVSLQLMQVEKPQPLLNVNALSRCHDRSTLNRMETSQSEPP